MGRARGIGAVRVCAGVSMRLACGAEHKLPQRARRLAVPLVTATLGAMIGQLLAVGIATAQAMCPNAAFRGGLSAQLPDCRAYEQVSPVDKHGAPAITPGYPAQASPDGESLADENFFGAYSDGQSASFPDSYVARRTAEGWETTNVSPPTPNPTPPGGDEVTYVFSEDLSQLVTTLVQQVLAENATPEVLNLFLSGTNAPRTYSWINSVRPPHVPPEGCPPSFLSSCFEFEDIVAPAGASSDFHHILFEGEASLVEGVSEFSETLYESTLEGGAWHVSLVGIRPDGTIPSGGSTAGSGSSISYKGHNVNADDRVMNAISQDGSRIVFQATADEGEPDPAQNGQTEVYDRINGNQTIELSAPAPGATPELAAPESATFWAASADGARVFFTSSAELTSSSYTGATEPKGQDLYEYDLQSEALTDLTVDRNPADVEEGAGVQGVVGASSDGSYVYFVAKGQLVPGKGVDHAENLYMVHGGRAPVYIATLSESDAADWTPLATELGSYVTPDGRHLAFTSVESLPTVNFPGGYNNVNQATSSAEHEVYEYSAPTAEEEEEGLTGSTVCASCDPSGALPIGSGLLGSAGRGESGQAGNTTNSAFHQARVVSDSGGRVFFSSKDPLVGAADGNTLAKVYEYEQDGEGTCQAAGGCVYLISSPTSVEEAFFLDADSEGNNVFFATSSRLSSTDHDGLIDVYDARVGGGLASPPEEVSCTGCRGQASEPPSVLAPLSGFAGASGDLVAAGGGKQGSRGRARKLASALRACHKKRDRRRRRLCEALARKRYRASASAGKSGRGGNKRGR